MARRLNKDLFKYKCWEHEQLCDKRPNDKIRRILKRAAKEVVAKEIREWLKNKA